MGDILLQMPGAPSAHGPPSQTPVWTDASAVHPCPICGAARGCGVIEGGEFARCLHVISPWPVLGGGWLHRVAERTSFVAGGA